MNTNCLLCFAVAEALISSRIPYIFDRAFMLPNGVVAQVSEGEVVLTGKAAPKMLAELIRGNKIEF